ncbi:MAG: hypothetical protein ACMG51_01570, partial [Ginsengibacter sp.]
DEQRRKIIMWYSCSYGKEDEYADNRRDKNETAYLRQYREDNQYCKCYGFLPNLYFIEALD